MRGVLEPCDWGTLELYVYLGGVILNRFLRLLNYADDLYGISARPCDLAAQTIVLKAPHGSFPNHLSCKP